MAKDIRSLVIDEGVTKQVGNDDTLQVGVGIKPSTGTALQIGAVDTDVSVPGSMTIDGDLDVQGAIGVVSTTTFQQDATFLGNVSFGDADAPVDDTVSFANAKINSDINFDGASPTYKITNLLDPTAGSQEAATAKYVDDGLDLKLDLTGGTMSGAIEMSGSSITGLGAPSGDNDAARKVYVDDGLDLKVSKAGDTMTGPLTISGNNDLYIGEDASPGGSLRFYGAFDQDLLVNPSYGVKALQNHLLLDATQNVDTSFGGTVKIGSDANTLAVDIGRVGSTLTVMANLSLNSNKITSLADPTAAQEAATKNYADSHLGGVAYTFPASDGSAGQVLKTDGNGELSWEADVSAPAGNDTEVQFNNAGVFGASANLTWNGSALSVTGDVAVSANLKADGELWIDAEAALPAAEAGYGKLAVKSDGDGVLFFVDSAGQAHYAMPDGLNSLGSVSGNVTLDFDPALPAYRTLTVGGALTFQTPSDNLAAGRGMSLRLDNSAGGSSTRVLTFPNDWTWLAGSKPVQIEAGKVGIVSLVAYGTADTDVVAAWSYSDSVSITGGGTAGQVAYFDGTRTIKSEGGLAWDETNDRLNIGNADNAAHSANLRVGGSAHIGGEVFLDGNVDLGDAAADVITVNGAMSLAAGASFDGTAGAVDLPAQFSIDGSAVSADVSAANLNTLTGGSDASALHSHKAVDLSGLTTTGVAIGEACYVSADDTVSQGDASAMASSVVLGIVSAAGVVATMGRVTAKFVASLSPAPSAGKPVYLAASGQLTTIVPTSGVLAEIGVVLNASAYAGAGTCDISLAIKAPIQLV